MIPGYAIPSAEAAPTLLATATGLSNPHGVAFDSFGNVYVAENFGNRVTKFTSDLSSSSTFVSGLFQVVGVAVDSSDNVYVTQLFGTVKKFSSAGTLLATASGFSNTRGVAVDSSGIVYVVEQGPFGSNADPHGNGKITKFTNFPSGGIDRTVIVSGLKFAAYAVVDSSDNVLVAETGAVPPQIAKVKRFDSNGVVLATSPDFSRSIGVAVDSSGNVYVSEQSSGKVFKCTSDLSSCAIFISGLNLGQQDLAVDSSGNVYVTGAATGTVKKFGDVAPPDTDGDGVIDDDDLCPGTPAGTPVDAVGCLLPPVIPNSVDVAKDVTIGDGTVLGENVIINKDSVIGELVTIGDNTEIQKDVTISDNVSIGTDTTVAKDVTIGSDVTIGNNVSIAKDVTIGSGTTIGDNTTIEKDVTIGDGAIIGNNVTIKKGAVIADNAMVPDGTVIPKNSSFP